MACRRAQQGCNRNAPVTSSPNQVILSPGHNTFIMGPGGMQHRTSSMELHKHSKKGLSPSPGVLDQTCTTIENSSLLISGLIYCTVINIGAATQHMLGDVRRGGKYMHVQGRMSYLADFKQVAIDGLFSL
eukprot:29023-Chlamydomonas_euryale.AAC.4